jgi:hypothetical protein
MGVSTATARSVFVCLSFFLVLFASTVPLRPVQAQTPKPAPSYDEKKRQANDIAVTVVVSGISCTCARFTEDIRNVVNDLGPDGVRVLPVLGVGGLQNVNDVLFLKNMDMAVVDEDNLRLLKKKGPGAVCQRRAARPIHHQALQFRASRSRAQRHQVL